MGLHYTVYCKKSVARVSPKKLLAGVSAADLHLIAEADGLSDRVIEAALAQLRIESVERGRGFHFYRLSYRPADLRQIDIERWQSAEERRAAVAEELEAFEDSTHPARKTIRTHLEATVDIVNASFGSMPGEQIAFTLASEVVRWLAEHYDGIIRAPDDTWWKLGRRHEYKPLRR